MTSNSRIVAVTFAVTLATVLAWYLVGYDIPVVPYGLFTGYIMYMVTIRKGFGDPAVISLFAFGLYAIMPSMMVGLLSDDPSIDDWGFDVQGAFHIYAIASVAMLVATGLAFVLYPVPEPADNPVSSSSFYAEAIAAATLSALLSMTFIAQHGIFQLGGSGNYLDRFAALATPGTGILALNAPLAIAALCFAIVSANRLASRIYLVCLVPYALLFISTGQRKYLLHPFLFLSFRFFCVRSFLQLVCIFAVAAIGYVAFGYLGFLREAEIPVSRCFDPATIALFVDDFQRYVTGEVYTLYLTAASAYEHVLDASFLQNYLGAFLGLLPNFLFGPKNTAIDAQFAELVSPETAELHGGFAYSYFGEAYLAGGIAGIFLATIAMTLFFRSIFVWGKGQQFRGLGGVVSLTMTYEAMWYIRLSFAIAVHEIVYQIMVIFLIHTAIRFSRARYERSQRTLQLHL